MQNPLRPNELILVLRKKRGYSSNKGRLYTRTSEASNVTIVHIKEITDTRDQTFKVCPLNPDGRRRTRGEGRVYMHRVSFRK